MISLNDGYCEFFHAEILGVAEEVVNHPEYVNAKQGAAWAQIASLTSREQWPELVQVYNENKLNF